MRVDRAALAHLAGEFAMKKQKPGDCDTLDAGGGIVRVAVGVGLSGIGVFLLAGGVWLLLVGGCLFYALSGLGFLGTAVLIVRRSTLSYWLFSFLIAATLICTRIARLMVLVQIGRAQPLAGAMAGARTLH